MLALGACFSPATKTCGSSECPSDLECRPSGNGCARPDEIAACAGLADGDPCTLAGVSSVCVDGACPEPICGNGIREGLEDCDGADLGGVTADCHTKGGYYDSPGLACTSNCKYDFSGCTGYCGDGIVNGDEVCDGPALDRTCVDFGFDIGVLGCLPHFCTPDFSRCGSIGWIRQNTPTSYSLSSVWVSSARDAYAVGGDASTLASVALHYDGTSWQEISTGASSELFAVSGSSASDVYVAGYPYGSVAVPIAHWNGNAWGSASAPANSYRGIYARAADDVYAVGLAGTIAHYDGTAWQSMSSGTSNRLLDVWARSATDAWAVGDGPTALHFDGTSWTTVATGTTGTSAFASVFGTGSTDVYIEQTDRVMHWNGTSWQSIQLVNLSSGFASGMTTSNGHVLFTGAGGVEDLSPDGQGTFFTNVNNLATSFYDVASDAAGHAFAVGGSGTVYSYRGTSWTSFALGTVSALWGADATHVFFVDGGGCAVYRGGSQSPVNMATPCSSTNLDAIHGSSASNVIAAGAGGSVVHYDGTNWTSVAFPSSTAVLEGAWVSSSTEWYVVGHDGGGVVYRDSSGAWTEVATATEAIHAIWGADAMHVFAVGDAGRLLAWDGTAWTSSLIGPAGKDLKAIWGTATNDIWIVGSGGTILHWNGTAWTPYSGGAAYALHAVWGTGPTDVFAGGDGGVVLHFDGQDWSVLRTPEAVAVRSIWGDGQHIYFAGFGVHSLDRTAFPGTCEPHEHACNDGIDDDCDFLVDCFDPDCAADPACL